MCWDEEGRRVPDLGAPRGRAAALYLCRLPPFEKIQEGGTGAAMVLARNTNSNPARMVQVVKPKTLGRMSPWCVHDLRGGIPGSISFEVHPQPPPPGRYASPPTRHINTWGGTGTSSAASAYCTSTACVVGRGLKVEPLVSKLHGRGGSTSAFVHRTALKARGARGQLWRRASPQACP